RDGGGDQRVLQRCQCNIFLPDARHAERGGVGDRADGGLGDLERNRGGRGVESERHRGRPQFVGAGVDAELDEGGVAGFRERIAQGGGRSGAARRSAVILQRCGAVRQRDSGCGGQLGVLGGTGLQRGRGRDDLEGGPWRIRLRDGSVQQRRVGIVPQLLPGGRLCLNVVGGKQVRVVRRRRDHREDLACRRLQRHYRALAGTVAAILHRIPGRLL